MDSVDSDPGRDEGENLGDQVDESIGIIVLVFACSPEFVQASASDNQRGVDLQAVRSELRILKVFLEAFYVPLDAHVWQIRHHVCDDLETAVLGQHKALSDRLHRVPSVGISSDVLIDALHSDLKSGTTVGQHVIQMWLQAVIWASFQSDCNTLCLALL